MVVPAWNEADGLASTLRALATELSGLEKANRIAGGEIVVVDDGSADSTATIARRFGPPVRVVGHPHNRGLGAAVRTGIAAARSDLVLYTDADLPADPSEIGTALGLSVGAPALVCACRVSRRGDGVRRYVYSVAYNWLVRIVLGIRVPDVNFAFKLLPAEAARALDLRSEGSFIDAEIVARARMAGLRTVTFPVHYHPRATGRSSLSSMRVVGQILHELWCLGPEIRASGR